MNVKLAEAIRWGPQRLLKDFVNLPVPEDMPGDKPKFPREAYEEFRKAYGDLWGPHYPISDYYDVVRAFRDHWTAKTEAQKQQLVSFVEKLFAGQLKPAKLGNDRYFGIRLTSQAGSVRFPIGTLVQILTSHRGPHDFEPRTLLDYLAVWLLTFRRQRKLGFCERKGCLHPYYVKDHPRYRYCSEACSYEASIGRKSHWWRKNRGVKAHGRTGK